MDWTGFTANVMLRHLAGQTRGTKMHEMMCKNMHNSTQNHCACVGGCNIPLEDEDEFRGRFPHGCRRIPQGKRRYFPQRRIPLRRRRVEDIFPEDKFPSEDEFPSEEEDEDTSPEDGFPSDDEFTGEAELPSEDEDEDEDISLEDEFPSEDQDEQTFSPKTRGCWKGRGALLRRERGGIERRGEVLYNEKARAVMRGETATKVEVLFRESVVTMCRPSPCVVRAGQGMRRQSSVIEAGCVVRGCVVGMRRQSPRVVREGQPSLAHMTFPSLAHICAHTLTCAHAHILDCHLRRYYPHTEPYKTMGYIFYLNLPPSALQSNGLHATSLFQSSPRRYKAMISMLSHYKNLPPSALQNNDQHAKSIIKSPPLQSNDQHAKSLLKLNLPPALQSNGQHVKSLFKSPPCHTKQWATRQVII